MLFRFQGFQDEHFERLQGEGVGLVGLDFDGGLRAVLASTDCGVETRRRPHRASRTIS